LEIFVFFYGRLRKGGGLGLPAYWGVESGTGWESLEHWCSCTLSGVAGAVNGCCRPRASRARRWETRSPVVFEDFITFRRWCRSGGGRDMPERDGFGRDEEREVDW